MAEAVKDWERNDDAQVIAAAASCGQERRSRPNYLTASATSLVGLEREESEESRGSSTTLNKKSPSLLR